jgi:hypothetical protein
VGGRQGVGVEGLAACGAPAVKAGTVPGGRAALTMPPDTADPAALARCGLASATEPAPQVPAAKTRAATVKAIRDPVISQSFVVFGMRGRSPGHEAGIRHTNSMQQGYVSLATLLERGPKNLSSTHICILLCFITRILCSLDYNTLHCSIYFCTAIDGIVDAQPKRDLIGVSSQGSKLRRTHERQG